MRYGNKLMKKTLVPHSYLENCPLCKSKLDLVHHIGEKRSKCTQCDYSEPGGNAEFISFLSNNLACYVRSLEVDTILLEGIEFTIEQCMDGSGLLPLFVERAQQIQQAAGLRDIEGFNLPLNLVTDEKGLLLLRVVMEDKEINIANVMSFLTEVVHEISDLTQKMGTKYYGNQICLDYMPNLSPLTELSNTSEQRFVAMLTKATAQATSGVNSGR